jgi:hypothetical protein
MSPAGRPRAEIEGYPVSDGECADNEEFRGSVAIGIELSARPARRRIQASRACGNRSSMIAAQDYGLIALKIMGIPGTAA